MRVEPSRPSTEIGKAVLVGQTLPGWVMLIIGGVVAFTLFRRRKATALPPLSEAEKARLAEIVEAKQR